MLLAELLAHELAAPVLFGGSVLGLDAGNYERHSEWFGGCSEVSDEPGWKRRGGRRSLACLLACWSSKKKSEEWYRWWAGAALFMRGGV